MRAVPVMSMVCVQGVVKLLCGSVLDDKLQTPLRESPNLLNFILETCKTQLDTVSLLHLFISFFYFINLFLVCERGKAAG